MSFSNQNNLATCLVLAYLVMALIILIIIIIIDMISLFKKLGWKVKCSISIRFFMFEPINKLYYGIIFKKNYLTIFYID